MKLCPYCGEEVGTIPVSDDDWIDYCHGCEEVLEGEEDE